MSLTDIVVASIGFTTSPPGAAPLAWRSFKEI